MCLSAQADVVGGVVIGAIGVDAIRHLDGRRGHAALAALPLLLAFHQLDEAFVWWWLQGHVASQVGRAAMWIYLLIAFVVLPVYLPVAVARTEPPGRRRVAMNLLVVLGAGVSALLVAAMLRGPVSAELGDFHISYGTGLRAEVAIAAVYIAATCGSLVLSSERSLALLGVVNLVAVVVLARVTLDGFASLWCAWAAVTCGLYALHLRADAPRSAGPGKLSAWADVAGGDSGSRS